ncbi:uncharacterized protein LOC142984217 [Anticarsia gemmatalis]|uniref:uncharacterized protein LOC142984217 n=1 Tax=Anticarsia gemmatalis TaxID=129554 RepID=UPI003F76136C
MKKIIIALSLFIVTETSMLDTINPDIDIIDELVLDGNQSHFRALILMKENKEPNEYEKQFVNNSLHNFTRTNDQDHGENLGLLNNKQLIISPIVLRASPWRGCQKKASKLCKKACKAAAKDACSLYDCRRKLKKALKKECKRNCKSYFMNS